MNIKESVIKIFGEVLEMNVSEIHLDDTFRNYKRWDSLAYLSIISMIDEEYDVVIDGNEFKKIATVEELIQEIKKRIK